MGKLFLLLQKKLMKLKPRLATLIPKTPLCKTCLKKRIEPSFTDLLTKNTICDGCFNSLKIIYKEEKIDGINYLEVYEYNDTFKGMLYNFKALKDIELGPLFLQRQSWYLRGKYKKCVLVPAPSTTSSDETRGFNHVETIFKILNLPIVHLFVKTKDFKQSDLNYQERQNILNKIALIKNTEIITKKHILIVDDVKTTGATIRAMVTLLKQHNPRSIKVLVLAYHPRQAK